MDNGALFKISYGLFVLGTAAEGKTNACMINTAMQVANDPTRISISVINKNYSAELLKKGGVFTVSMLDTTTKFETIKYFGFQSGYKVDKLKDMPMEKDANGVPYLTWNTCAVLSCKVVEKHDLGSHTVFVGEVVDAKILNNNTPLTYAYYQENIKPKEVVNMSKKIKGWRCKICGYVYEGAELPKDFICPLCGHPAEDFEPIYED